MVGSIPATDKPARSRFRQPTLTRTCSLLRRIARRWPPNHRARLIDRAVDRLDLSELEAQYARSGSPAYPLVLMLKIVLSELHSGRQSPAQWCRDLQDSKVLFWLGLGIQPSRSRLSAFRDRLGPWIDQLHRQILRMALGEGLTQGTRAALDGSTIAAWASRHKLLNERTLLKRLDLLKPACRADTGPLAQGAPPAWMAGDRASRWEQQQRYQTTLEQLRQRQQENQRRRACKRRDPAKLVIAPNDPEAAVGLDKLKVDRPLYNAQVLDDLDSPLILASDVFAQQNDNGTLGPMLERMVAATGHQLRIVLADPTSATVVDVGICERAGVTLSAPSAKEPAAPRQLPKSQFVWSAEEQVYRCPAGHPLRKESSSTERRGGGQEVQFETDRCAGEHCRGCPLQARCTRNPTRGRSLRRAVGEERLEGLRERMSRAESKAWSKLRRPTVELCFGDAKEHRQLRRFWGRGLVRARTQVGLNVLVHNLLALERYLEAKNCLEVSTLSSEKISA